jgi:hypothetical protein
MCIFVHRVEQKLKRRQFESMLVFLSFSYDGRFSIVDLTDYQSAKEDLKRLFSLIQEIIINRLHLFRSSVP